MKTLIKTNPLALLTHDIHSDQVPNTYKLIINALTGIVGSNLMRHIKYGDSMVPAIPTLDERNEQDENKIGDAANDIRNEAFGISHAPLSAFKIASIANGIRHSLYEEMHAYGEFDDAKYLNINAPYDIHARINYDQPMSLEMYMQYRHKMAAVVDPKRVAMGAKQLNKPAELIHDILMQQAIKDAEYISKVTPAVLCEVSTLDTSADIDSFMAFDIILQCKVIEKVAEGFSKAYARLLPFAIGNLERASDLNMIEQHHIIAKNWLRANDTELQAAIQHAQAIRAS